MTWSRPRARGLEYFARIVPPGLLAGCAAMSSHTATDARDLAFDALLPLAKTTAAALERVDKAVADERKVMDPLRKGFNPTLNAGALGLGRFGYAVREV